MLLEVVTEHLGVSILGLQMLRHWNPGHLSASLEHKMALLVKPVHKLFRVWSHYREEPVASILLDLAWNEITHLLQLSSHLTNEA
jgi:hypothetical protein